MASTEPTHPASPDELAGPSRAAGNADGGRGGYEVSSPTWLVHGAIVVAFALFVSMVALLFARWWSDASVPNASIEFLGDERLNGVQIRIDGTNLNAAVTQKLAAENRYRVRFAVPAGTYLVWISRDGVPLAPEASITVNESAPPSYDLSRLLAAATPPSQ